MSTEPIPRRKLYQEVLDRLMTRINAGEFTPGEQLPSERELMDAYGVGRPAIREALQQLERSGIVTISHGERARVLLPTAEAMVGQMAEAARYLLSVEPRTLEHLKEARILLEAGVARLAAQRVDADALALLRARLDDHRQASLDDFLRSDIAFHRQIAVMSGNPVFPAIVEAMLTWLGAYYRTLVRAPGAERLTLQEHQRIYDAIAAGDADEAAQAMSDHLNRANALYRRGATDELTENRP
ncbi:MAG TPA: transcriptional regulator NanR [Bosea sp. (in: a-proteobacteria)]|jgi:DNA-binding FadR family transcriptional regulator|uniref:transcriptional regulator NanR n=1 Tax=Bosea sp. (in: a-proteobacteria) TaxID=1871050 RepID=UPI002E1587D9|nr:transcriptional regulator NanR [Bosea sp. (in: a-proteobacteria)]